MRYPFIPPAKKRRIPSTRPVTILDTPPADGGWEYRASYCGIPLQVFSQRPVNGELLQAGDTIIARWVPGAEQLWFPSPERSLEALYFSPGGLELPSGQQRGELWKLALDGVPIKVWTAPRDAEGIICIWWSQIDNQLYFSTWYNGAWGMEDFIYRFNRSTHLATEVAHWTISFSDAGYDPNPVVDVAEYGSYIYLHCAYNWMDPACEVLRFDPIAETVALVFTYPNPAYTGGVAVDPTAPAIVAFSGYQVYRSPSGDLGSWVLDKDFNADEGVSDCFSMITHKGDSNYIYAGLAKSGAPNWEKVVGRRTAPAAWAIDLNHAGGQDNGVVTFTIEYDSSGTVLALYAQFWNWWTYTQGAHVYRKPVGGVWALDWVGPADDSAPPDWPTPGNEGWVGVACQGLQQGPDGKIYGLWFDMPRDKMRLYRRDGAGVWVMVQQWDDYASTNDWLYTSMFGMALAPNNLFKCHEV